MNYQIITCYDDLVASCESARKADTVMLDTEFVRIRSYHPKLGLVQLFDGETTSLIDPITISDLSPLAELLQDRSVQKVLHACGEDIEVFQHALGCVPTPMIDTQILAAFLGFGISTGFATLVKEFVGVELDKSESRTDWVARPLTQKQLDYAAADVIYLAPLYTALVDKVKEKGWWEAANAESLLQIEKRLRITPRDKAYIDIKGAWSLEPKALATLQLLADWRMEEAQRRDLALNFIIRENDLVQIARLGLTDEQQMAKQDIDPMALKRHGRRLTKLVKQSLKIDSSDFPTPLVPLNDYPGYKQLFKVLKAKVKAVSDQTGLPPEFIASRKQINQLISFQWKQTTEATIPDVLQSWREELIGQTLQKLIPAAPAI